MLYPRIKTKKVRKAHFVKLKINIPDGRVANVMIRFLFLIPIPIWLVTIIVRRRLNQYVSDDIPISFRDLIHLVSIKGSHIKVMTSDHTNILIKTI